jgi:DNA-binding response OmpR family regulator
MDILLVERDRLVRDQVKVGLQQFPEFTVTWGEGYAAINELRQRRYDLVFLGCDNAEKEVLRLLKHLRSFNQAIEVVLIVAPRTAKDLAAEKGRLNIQAFLHTPIDVRDFFRLVARLRTRLRERDKSPDPMPTVPARR